MEMKRQPHRAVIYVRISKDRDEQTSTESQERIARDYAASKGWEVAGVEIDKGRSAFNGKAKRPALRRAMKLIEGGGADVLIVWRLDRLARSVADFTSTWQRLEDAGGQFVSVVEQFDTTSSMGRAMLQIAAVFAELESGIKSERITAWHEERRLKGATPTGPRPYGYRRIDGELRIDEVEAGELRCAAHKVLQGESLRSCVADLNARNVPTSTDSRWSSRGLRHVLTTPTSAGLRVVDDMFVAGSWVPLLGRDEWDELRSRLLDPARLTAQSNRPRWMLTGLVTCGRCGDRLRAKPHTAGTRYTCGTCSLSAPAERLDDLVSSSLLDAIDARAWKRMRGRGRAPAVDVARLEAELQELAEMYGAGELTMDEWRTMRAGITKRIAESDAEPTELPDVDNLKRSWPELSVHARQLVLGAVMEAITLAPAVRGRNTFDPHRVSIIWRH